MSIMYNKQYRMVRPMKAILMVACLMIAVSSCKAQSRATGNLLALSKKDHTLAIVDPATLKVLAKMPVGSDPHEVIASADGRTAYVSIYGGGSLHEIDVIDLVGHKSLAPIETKPFFGPHGITFIAGKLWFTAEGSKAVARYDPATRQFDWAMGTGQERTHMIYVTADGRRVYTTNMASGTVSILTETMIQPPPSAPAGTAPRPYWTQTLVPVSRGSEGFDVSPDGRQLWTAASEDGAIAVIDLASGKVTDKIDAGVLGANRLQFTPDGKMVLITSLRSGDLVIYSSATHKEIKKINIGHGAAGILVEPDGSRAFIGCTPDDYVAVIDLKKFELTARIDVGGGPDGLAWTSLP